MSRELEIGDTIEALREIVYPGEGLVVPAGRSGTVRKVKLDHREHLAAVTWDGSDGLYGLDMSGGQYMKKPIEVVAALGDAPYTIQWPSRGSKSLI